MAKIRAACKISGDNCEQPAGWGGSYGYSVNRNLKPLETCFRCGEPVCDACSVVVAKYERWENVRLCDDCLREAQEDGRVTLAPPESEG